MLSTLSGNLPRIKGSIVDAIAISVLEAINLSLVFRDLDNHMFDTPIYKNHIFTLVKLLAKCYCKIRLHQLGKFESAKVSGVNVRKTLSKLVLFKNQ